MLTQDEVKKITEALNAIVVALRNVLPMTVNVQNKKLTQSVKVEKELGVSIGVVGDVHGSVVIGGKEELFTTIGERMYGMALTGEMLDSFTGELGNMISGNLATNLSQHAITMDISTPEVFKGTYNMEHFEKGIHLEVNLEEIATLDIILSIK